MPRDKFRMFLSRNRNCSSRRRPCSAQLPALLRCHCTGLEPLVRPMKMSPPAELPCFPRVSLPPSHHSTALALSLHSRRAFLPSFSHDERCGAPLRRGLARARWPSHQSKRALQQSRRLLKRTVKSTGAGRRQRGSSIHSFIHSDTANIRYSRPEGTPFSKYTLENDGRTQCIRT